MFEGMGSIIKITVGACLLTGCAVPPIELQRINNEINRVPYVSDMERHGMKQHPKDWQENWWALDIEDFYRNGGDCEDYAIAKYVQVRTLGYASWFYVTPDGRHALLRVYDRKGNVWEMDNMYQYMRLVR